MRKPETITSAGNPLLKDVRYAVHRGALTADGWAVAESFHLLEEALRSDCEVKAVITAASVQAAAETHVRGLKGIRVIVVPDALFQGISGTETAQGVMALVKPNEWNLPQLLRGCPLVVVLDGLQDPGNAGAILRAAEAFGATGALFLKGTVNPYNPKALRGSAGSAFRIPLLYGMDPALARAALQQHKIELYAGVPAHHKGPARPVAEADFNRPCGLIIGSEAHGVSEALRGAALDVTIPTIAVESLNAAVAAGILLYEARRQRSMEMTG